ncbi:hypothetical protein J6590_103378 [Homalodisca vitripennis]|nr:hypothetical protein J6590_103378 [Homalodisca vitripennis]
METEVWGPVIHVDGEIRILDYKQKSFNCRVELLTLIRRQQAKVLREQIKQSCQTKWFDILPEAVGEHLSAWLW